MEGPQPTEEEKKKGKTEMERRRLRSDLKWWPCIFLWGCEGLLYSVNSLPNSYVSLATLAVLVVWPSLQNSVLSPLLLDFLQLGFCDNQTSLILGLVV
jgi:hypothetical protein